MDIINPATGAKLGKLSPDTPESLAKKFEAAQKAQKEWQETPLVMRKKIIERFGDALQKQLQELAETLSAEVGKPIGQAKNEIKAVDARIKFFLENVDTHLKVRKAYQDETLVEEISKEPLGVIANISAWNYPYFVGVNVFVPALLTGNGVLYKPSEYATLTGRKICELMYQAGLPGDLMPLIEGAGDVGKELLKLPVDGVFFTGSYQTGIAIKESVARRTIPVGLELGGKDPCYVTNDVRVDQVAPQIADGAFYNNGQSCCAIERIYVHEDIYEAFLEHFLAAVRDFTVGYPDDDNVYLGPLTRGQQVQFLVEQIEDAKRKGASVAYGGYPLPELSPHYFQPTVLVDVNHTMSVMRDETFGPVIGIQKVAGDQEALRLMQDTDYGLTASVFCQELSRARDILRYVNAGTVYNNCSDRVSPYVPWSGRGHSGFGSTLGQEGIRAFLKPKSWQLRSL